MKTKYIVGNWKLNPPTPREAKALLAKLKKNISGARGVKVIVCPPAVFLPLFDATKKKNFFLGAQDALSVEFGAFTGALNPQILKYSGCDYVILGHSEVRERSDDNAMVALKARAVLKSGLTPVVCVGEKKRDTQGNYLEFLREQLTASLSGIPKKDLAKIIIAYEPVWAIGITAKESDTSADFLHNSLFIRKVLAKLAGQEIALKIPILYGGSVNEKNAEDFLRSGEASGLLVGRASLDVSQFGKIIKIAESL